MADDAATSAVPRSEPPGLLIVDDNGRVRHALRDWLEGVFPGLTVLEAGSGEEALEVIGGRWPTVVLLDVGLPGMDGVEVARRIGAFAPEVAVVMLSIHEDDHYRESARAAGVVAYVPKRTMQRDLVPALAPLLSGGE